MKVLVTGGCGYIGSHTLIDLVENGFEPVNVDSNIRSQPENHARVEQIVGRSIPFYAIDLCDKAALKIVFEEHPDISGIIHFAALKTVPESVDKSLFYYRNNLVSLLNLLELVEEFSIANFVFSSSCSVYGNVSDLPVTEKTARQEAESPYGNSKRMGEDLIRDAAKNSEHQFISLRYFNPIGAHPSGKIGEIPYGPPQNLQPIIMEVGMGKREKLSVFGSDYPTRDGTCVRDYIHVCDLANAHTLALQFLAERKEKETDNYAVFNVGSGQGSTVLEMITAFETATGESLNYELVPRRAGDVMAIYADNQQIREKLGWSPRFSLIEMMQSAWEWQKQLITFK